MAEATPTSSDLEAAFAYAQKINDLYSLGPGSPECESINQKETDKHAVTLLKVGVWAFPDPQDAFRAETALFILHKHVGEEVKSMYRRIKTLDKFNEFRGEASRRWIPNYAERLKQLHYDLNGLGVWLSESHERRFSDARIRLWELKETLDVLAAYKAEIEQEGFECSYLYLAENVSFTELFSDPEGGKDIETGGTPELYLVLQNRYDTSKGWTLTGHLEIEETTQEDISQPPTQHRVSDNILFHTPDEKLRILSGAPMKLPLLPSSAPIMSGVRTIHGILDTVGKKLWSNGLFVAYPKE